MVNRSLLLDTPVEGDTIAQSSGSQPVCHGMATRVAKQEAALLSVFLCQYTASPTPGPLPGLPVATHGHWGPGPQANMAGDLGAAVVPRDDDV
ncbi:unnamed protein product [Lota lota]